jgi:hypothetical protein
MGFDFRYRQEPVVLASALNPDFGIHPSSCSIDTETSSLHSSIRLLGVVLNKHGEQLYLAGKFLLK